VLILKMAGPGEMLGLSAVISGGEYELTAETAMPCQVNYVAREPLLDLLQRYGEAGLRSAQALSREFQAAYRDIHDLILAPHRMLHEVPFAMLPYHGEPLIRHYTIRLLPVASVLPLTAHRVAKGESAHVLFFAGDDDKS
jgi:CRP-like cAMP-binding protein